MRKDTLATRQLLIDTAEKIFAEKGLESTTLFDVFKASGIKNRSALQYHFKDKVGLINAVLNKHSEAVSNHRKTLIDALEKAPSHTLYDVVKVIVEPLAEKLDTNDGGREFLKIHSQLMVSEPFSELRMQRPERLSESQLIQVLLQPFLQNMSGDSMQARIVLMDCLLIHGLAACLAQDSCINREVFLQTLMQSMVDLLSQDGVNNI